MLHLVKPLQTKVLAWSISSKPDCLQTQTTDSPILFPWINTPGMCHAWMLADSSCSCRYPCFQPREDQSGDVKVHSDLLQLKTSWWKLVLRMGLSKGSFCHFPDVTMLLLLFRDAQSGCLCEVSPFRATIHKAVLRRAVGCLTLFPALWCWLWVLGEVWEQEKSTLVGTVGFNTRMCGYQHPAKS